MLQMLIGKFWRNMPLNVRRFVVRSTQPRFRVTVGAVVVDAENRILLLRHVLRQGRGWGIPGGFLEKGEHPGEAMRRELREETGVEIKA
ncbi:MAG: NUDIX hydrolase [Pyrinomonadaceae bacterium]